MKPRVVIVHDSIQYWGGAEKVLLALKRIFPEAPIYTATIAWNNLGIYKDLVKRLRIQTSWAQHIPYFPENPFLYRYLLPIIWNSINVSSYDIVITSSGSQMSHLVRTHNKQIHICYCHTPPRHLYGYKTDFDWKRNIFIRILASVLNIPLRMVDKQAAKRVTYHIANSDVVKQRIKKIYNRDAIVIYPPVSPPKKRTYKKKNYYLVVSRLSRMKHIDIIIEAFNELKLPLYIVGIGPERSHLQSIAGPTIRFFGQVDDQTLSNLYSEAKALICAAEEEDFGITPVEAILHNTPVVAYDSGGHRETVINKKTGILFKTLNINAIKNSIYTFEKNSFQLSFQKKLYQISLFDHFKNKLQHLIYTKNFYL